MSKLVQNIKKLISSNIRTHTHDTHTHSHSHIHEWYDLYVYIHCCRPKQNDAVVNSNVAYKWHFVEFNVLWINEMCSLLRMRLYQTHLCIPWSNQVILVTYYFIASHVTSISRLRPRRLRSNPKISNALVENSNFREIAADWLDLVDRIKGQLG